MNGYLLALIGLIGMFAVGFIVYRLFNRDELAVEQQPKSMKKVVLSVLGLYAIALAFITLYDAVIFPSGALGMWKGLNLGFIVGLFGFVLPFLVDASHLRTQPVAIRAVAINWFVSFIVLGLIVGALS